MKRSAILFGMMAVAVNSAYADKVPGVTDTEILLGNHSNQTGPQAQYGLLQRAMKAYFDQVNEKGGVHGRKIKLLMGDSAGNNQQALQVIKKQVEEDGVFAIVGGGNNQHMAVFRYLREKGVPDLFVGTGSPDLTVPPHKTTFAWSPTSPSDGEGYAKLILKKWPKKKIGVIYDESDNGRGCLKGFMSVAEGKLNVVATESNDAKTDPTAKAQILNLKRAGAEVVYMATLPNVSPVALKFAHEQGFKPQWVLSFHNSYQNVLDLAGKGATEGAIGWYYTYNESETHLPAVREHIEFMKKRLPTDKIGSGSFSGVGLGELIVETLNRAGKDLTRESVVKAAESFKDWKCTVCRSPNSTGPDKHAFHLMGELSIVKEGKWTPYTEKH